MLAKGEDGKIKNISPIVTHTHTQKVQSDTASVETENFQPFTNNVEHSKPRTKRNMEKSS